MKKICIVGLGYVGLPLAIEFGKLRSVIGFDISSERIKELNSGYDRTMECDIDQLNVSSQLTFTNKISDIANCEIYIVTVPTPIDQANRPDLQPLIAASKLVGSVLSKGDIVIYESTVYPGATEEVCVPVLQVTSGLTYNTDFFCGYSPERIVPGDKVNTLTKIKKITSGSNEEVSLEVDALYKSIIDAGTWKASSIKVAEAAKVIENSQRDLNIAFVNELSIIFEKIGIDTLEVLEAAGTKWNFLPFRPGMVGGHCIGVDPYYLTHKSEELGYHPQVILAGRRINDNMARHAAQSVVKKMIKNGIDPSKSTVGLFGITFKDNCPDIRNSKVIDLIKELESWGLEVMVVDPWADEKEVLREYGIELVKLSQIDKVDSIVISVAHRDFYSLDLAYLRSLCKTDQPVLADLKSIVDVNEARQNGFTVHRL